MNGKVRGSENEMLIRFGGNDVSQAELGTHMER